MAYEVQHRSDDDTLAVRVGLRFSVSATSANQLRRPTSGKHVFFSHDEYDFEHDNI